MFRLQFRITVPYIEWIRRRHTISSKNNNMNPRLLSQWTVIYAIFA